MGGSPDGRPSAKARRRRHKRRTRRRRSLYRLSARTVCECKAEVIWSSRPLISSTIHLGVVGGGESLGEVEFETRDTGSDPETGRSDRRTVKLS
ncbi:hypothetical protein EVAR_59812_1 [Eumeta japonica]|uniref:Uncharacterized protein n=1 Tax=Eumeta variegata TaxID=151549 RepID=A0A4C1YC56_EUMVA|nr:hypothetical protein EVAR_59812_1 [Eumeta japonica]